MQAALQPEGRPELHAAFGLFNAATIGTVKELLTSLHDPLGAMDKAFGKFDMNKTSKFWKTLRDDYFAIAGTSKNVQVVRNWCQPILKAQIPPWEQPCDTNLCLVVSTFVGMELLNRSEPGGDEEVEEDGEHDEGETEEDEVDESGGGLSGDVMGDGEAGASGEAEEEEEDEEQEQVQGKGKIPFETTEDVYTDVTDAFGQHASASSLMSKLHVKATPGAFTNVTPFWKPWHA